MKAKWMMAAFVATLVAVPLTAALRGGADAGQFGGSGAAVAGGRALFEANACFDCHRIGDRGSRLGPDLSDVGSLRDFNQLRRAIVDPDAEVYPEHRSVRLVTKDGGTVTGRLLNQDAFSVQVMTADEQLTSYAKSDLGGFTILDAGLMPSYDGKLTLTEIAEIVRYLQSLERVEP